MKIVHGTWIPQNTDEFIQNGGFYLWVERLPDTETQKIDDPIRLNPLTKKELEPFLIEELNIKNDLSYRISAHFYAKYFSMPSVAGEPLPSLEAMKYSGDDFPDTFEFRQWKIPCFKLDSVIKRLNDIHFVSIYNDNIQLGADVVFWHQVSMMVKEAILKDLYIPKLIYHEVGETKSTVPRSSTKKATKFAIYSSWQILSEKFETHIKQFTERMPLICACGSDNELKSLDFYDKESLLRHFTESLLYDVIANTRFTAKLYKQFTDTFLSRSIHEQSPHQTLWTTDEALDAYKKWYAWKEKFAVASADAGFDLCFRLVEALTQSEQWFVEFVVASKIDPSSKMPLSQYWRLSEKKKQALNAFGEDFERKLLLNMGFAAQIYPKIWTGLESDNPAGISLTLEQAFDFLKETAWILEDAGYKVIIPSWWTPKGRRKAKIRLKTSSSTSKTSKSSKGYFSLDSIILYHYELCIGDEAVTHKEWEQLVNSKTPLVQFHGQWVELDREKMKEMLEFWENHSQTRENLSLLEILKIESEYRDQFEFNYDDILGDIMAKLRNFNQLEPVQESSLFCGQLRPYQRLGVAWLQFFDNLGLNPCLADDMGLGKTVQVIAQLAREKEQGELTLPSLLIAPTSVIGNWVMEIKKFAPALTAIIHHGPDRIKEEEPFQEACLKHDLMITSFSLSRKDEKLFRAVQWRRIIVDEAQNIKNPKSGQSRAIVKFQSQYRLALTGTPIENRLMDLWSIFSFLNPGYLGKEATFRKLFEIPVQKENNLIQAETLKKMVGPFILRRLKTDKSIINDLPDKVEIKQYCNLTKEQASLYEAVVRDVRESLDNAEGIQRKGLILSSLLKLKQICNHPVQFLQDNSEFSDARSHKLKRLTEMLEEILDNNESVLVFTQFTEIGEPLERYIKKSIHCLTYYLHGGTARPKREQMIANFQDPESEPSVFVLSLKAGGVGLTLTKANHVFHFDRWWNPAVENQATDRAFRIGQTKNVFVHKFITIGTLEEKIDFIIEDKKKLASSIIGATDESWLTELDNQAFLDLIELRREATFEE
jgi:SNF2 family DNA or RNA helicase